MKSEKKRKKAKKIENIGQSSDLAIMKARQKLQNFILFLFFSL